MRKILGSHINRQVSEGEIWLKRGFFAPKEEWLLAFEGLKAFPFVYETGVSGVRLGHKNGYIIVLPYKGQQVWDAIFDGTTRYPNYFLTSFDMSRRFYDLWKLLE